ncbi:MAG: hypothetical protein GEU75_07665 [Dehalococcoidia bacterium]|nr:hypothetical protein [Dehalococcoidia bacterium]
MKLVNRVLCLGFVPLAILLIACGGDDDSSPTSGAPTAPPPTNPTTTAANPAPSGPSISVADFSYSPAALTVPAGQVAIATRNMGPSPHTFTIDNVVDVQLNAGQSTAIQFSAAAGSYTFYCTLHGRSVMSGQLTVQ